MIGELICYTHACQSLRKAEHVFFRSGDVKGGPLIPARLRERDAFVEEHAQLLLLERLCRLKLVRGYRGRLAHPCLEPEQVRLRVDLWLRRRRRRLLALRARLSLRRLRCRRGLRLRLAFVRRLGRRRLVAPLRGRWSGDDDRRRLCLHRRRLHRLRELPEHVVHRVRAEMRVRGRHERFFDRARELLLELRGRGALRVLLERVRDLVRDVGDGAGPDGLGLGLR
mmetsp:Transcript_19600/g.63634  ORF Transcript_19600/g.63634 Transcript_19600/m.63634 type:complete len:225 (-) Transcript_19600:1804-2478(-)